MIPTKKYVQKACEASTANTDKFYDALIVAMTRYEINTPKRIAAFLATIEVESAKLTATEESLYYSSPDRLTSIFKRAFKSPAEALPYIKNPKALSQKLYNGFHGRGLIQLTWEENYRKCGTALGVDFVANPSLLSTPQYAALSAAWFWSIHNCNQWADQSDMDHITLEVNGKAKLALQERIAEFKENMQPEMVAQLV
jgi:putative chitinase